MVQDDSYRLMMIFLSPRNPCWVQMLGRNLSQGPIIKICGVSDQNFSNWRRGGAIQDKSAQKVFAAARAKARHEARPDIEDRIRHFETEYFNPNGNFEEACAIIGASTEVRQFAVDQANFATRPMLPEMYYPTQGEAKSVLDREGGHYLMALQRENQWVQCPVHIAYVLQGSTKDRFVIRCKMNIPRLQTQKSRMGNHYQYDGFISTHGGALFWILEKRRDDDSDYFSIVTKVCTYEGARNHVGHYVTLGQKDTREVAHGDLYLQPATVAEDEHANFMTSAKILSDDEAKIAEAYLFSLRATN